ncbi:MAG: hydroxylamine reductase, partial [Firmicutes bacterium ML8_F2]
MFCFQCQETAKNEGCTIKGVCGKSPKVAKLQDLLIYLLKGISISSLKADEQGIGQTKVNKFIVEGLFSTITNVNFDSDYFRNKIKEALVLRDEIVEKTGENRNEMHDAQIWSPQYDADIKEKAGKVGVLVTENEDIRSLRELITYGLKGLAAYADHAFILGYSDDDIFGFIKKALAATLDDSLSADYLISLTLETGQYGVNVMALLDKANTSTYGDPEITKVNIGVKDNPGILISGHDLKDLEELLEQTKGTGVDVYTHGEMLPAHYYPFFKKYDHFVGNYGNAWWKQKDEFESFNGPVLLTTNCLVPPKDSYKDRVYTTGTVGFSGLTHIPDREAGKVKDFSPIIEHAKKCDAPQEIETGEIVGGFAHGTVLGL